MVNSDDTMLNNHQISPTLELIDIDGVSSNTVDDYSRSNSRADVSDSLILRKKIDRMNE
jgi:hypothetical protein